jgi:hypothetical protein
MAVMTVDELFKGIVNNVHGTYTTWEVAKDKWNKTINCLKRAGFRGTEQSFKDTWGDVKMEAQFTRVGDNPEGSDYIYSLNMWYTLDHHAEVIYITIKGEKRTSLNAKDFKVEWFNCGK